MSEHIKENIDALRSRAQQAFDRRGQGGQLTFLAATKNVPVEQINFAYQCGITDIGENRVQELLEKYDRLNPNLNVHFIGKLQRNKVKYIIDKVKLIHSVDNVRLGEEINRQAAKINKVVDVLAEVNIGEEENKSGVLPDALGQLMSELVGMGNIRVVGLMTMAPFCADQEEYRKYFSKTYKIFIDFFEKKEHNIGRGFDGVENAPPFPLLSMGMSDSFITAIECGANIVRVGSALFGKR